MKKLLILLIIPFLSFGQMVATEDCNSIPEIGPCFADIVTYYFNQNTSQCEESSWGGCGGLVAFWTLESCQNSCENIEIQGCTGENACNYDENATVDDGGCEYPGDLCEGFDLNLEEVVYGVLDDDCECGLPLSIDIFLETNKIIKVVNVLGQKSEIDSKEKILIYIYDDGSVEKKYLIK